jgi:MFS superfamily sulfate permease-like transporter
MFKNSSFDLKAGLVVFLVALPLCLGIALAQKAPLFSGIISGVVGGIVVACISGSRLSVSGPAAGLTAIVLSAVASLGSFEVFLLALCMAGVIQIILGVIKAGIIGYYFPSSVIKGMLAAIGVILIIKQLPHLVGYDADTEGDFSFIQTDGHNSLSELLYMLNYLSPGSVIIGFVSLSILLLWDSGLIKKSRILSAMPAALLVVLAGIGINELLIHLNPDIDVKPEHLVNLPHIGSWTDFTASITFPSFAAFTNPKVYEVAFTLAVVASLETLLCIEAIDKLDPENNVSPTNRELIAQGVGNLICGLIGGIPVTSVIVRSSANLNAGGKTRLSPIFHGLLLVVCVLFIPSVLEKIPYSALAGILIYTGYKLCRPQIIKNVYRSGWDQFLPFIFTILLILLTDLLKGVSVGIVISVIFILRQNYRNPYKYIHDTIEGVPHYFIKLSQNVTFLNKGKIVDTLHKIPKGAKVYIDGGRAQFIDKDVLEAISEFKRSAPRNNIEVILEDIKEVELISAH